MWQENADWSFTEIVWYLWCKTTFIPAILLPKTNERTINRIVVNTSDEIDALSFEQSSQNLSCRNAICSTFMKQRWVTLNLSSFQRYYIYYHSHNHMKFCNKIKALQVSKRIRSTASCNERSTLDSIKRTLHPSILFAPCYCRKYDFTYCKKPKLLGDRRGKYVPKGP